jgi:hypothetical protein
LSYVTSLEYPILDDLESVAKSPAEPFIFVRRKINVGVSVIRRASRPVHGAIIRCSLSCPSD